MSPSREHAEESKPTLSLIRPPEKRGEMNAAARLDPNRSYTLAEVAPMLGLEIVALQARLRRAEKRDGWPPFVNVTPWILAFRTCGGRVWSFCAARKRGSPSDDQFEQVAILEPHRTPVGSGEVHDPQPPRRQVPLRRGGA